jgi:hypothetical protein
MAIERIVMHQSNKRKTTKMCGCRDCRRHSSYKQDRIRWGHRKLRQNIKQETNEAMKENCLEDIVLDDIAIGNTDETLNYL